jgi:retron-type reverse transcriptase
LCKTTEAIPSIERTRSGWLLQTITSFLALRSHLRAHWPRIREQLVAGTYQHRPVKYVEILKPDGRKRLLGIPTVVDRFIQQAIAQVVQQHWEQHVHPNSFGLRPGRNAH